MKNFRRNNVIRLNKFILDDLNFWPKNHLLINSSLEYDLKRIKFFF
jgi:hypothetical protein